MSARDIDVHLLDLEKTLAYEQAAHLHQLRFRKIDGGWEALIKVHQDGQFRVAFIIGQTFAAMLSNVSEQAWKATIEFRRDIYPPNQSG